MVLHSRSTKPALDITRTIYVGIFRQAVDMSAFFQTSTRYVDIFFGQAPDLLAVFLGKHEICWNSFRVALGMSTFFRQALDISLFFSVNH